jgi:hypothetical protein
MKGSYIFISEELVDDLITKQDRILQLLESSNRDFKGEYITEKEAKGMFSRKSTWFWHMRKTGVLPFSKIGKSIYYSMNDLQKLMKDSRVNPLK